MWSLLAKVARYLPAEAAHRVAVAALHYNLGPPPTQRDSKVDLGVRLAGLEFANPLGLAAGFDKNATCFNGAMDLGFAHVEVGTITPKPQPGNPTLECQSFVSPHNVQGSGMYGHCLRICCSS